MCLCCAKSRAEQITQSALLIFQLAMQCGPLEAQIKEPLHVHCSSPGTPCGSPSVFESPAATVFRIRTVLTTN